MCWTYRKMSSERELNNCRASILQKIYAFRLVRKHKTASEKTSCVSYSTASHADHTQSSLAPPSFRSLTLLSFTWSNCIQDVLLSTQKHHMVVCHDWKRQERERRRSYWGMTRPPHATTTTKTLKPTISTALLQGHRDQEERPEDRFKMRRIWGLLQALRQE